MNIFAGAVPQRYLWVSTSGDDDDAGTQSAPLRSIQQAVDIATPGTAIMVKAGTYTENIVITSNGTASAPIWLISADGKGSARIRPDDDGDTIKGNNAQNIVVQGFDVTGADDANAAIHFTQSGSNFTRPSKNIVIIDNIVHGGGGGADGIKAGIADNVYVLNNTVDGAGDQGIDFVAVIGGEISGNEVFNVEGNSGIQVKGGSTGITVSGNDVHDVEQDGIHVGGGTDESSMRPGYDSFEAKNIVVSGNTIHDVGLRAAWFMGAQNSSFIGNLVFDVDYARVIHLIASDSSHDPELQTKNITITGNSFDRSNWLVVDSGQGVGLVQSANVTNGGPVPGGSGGNDTQTGGGNDSQTGGGNDTQTGGGNDTQTGGGNDTQAGGGNDTQTGGGNDTQTGGGNDTQTGGGNDTQTGGGNDTQTGGGGDTQSGGGIPDPVGAGTVLYGSFGDDLFAIARPEDIVVEQVGWGTDEIGSPFSYALPAHVEHLTLLDTAAVDGTGNALDNRITGNAANNRLHGLDGDDTLDGGGGVDDLNGGPGNDVYVVDSPGTSVVEMAGEGIDEVRSTLAMALPNNVENLTLVVDADLDAVGNDLDNRIVGAGGRGIIAGYLGNDTLDGAGANDTLDGGRGDDLLDGGSGVDRMLGSLGDDVYVVDDADDVTLELPGQGEDEVRSTLDWVLGAEIENLVLLGPGPASGIGNALDNAITSGAGNDRLDGRAGRDTLAGGTGDDVYMIDDPADRVIEEANAGNDEVVSFVSYVLPAGVERLTLAGSANLSGTGNGGANVLTGNLGSNTLSGMAAGDTLIGGGGKDLLFGGGGADHFVFVDVSEIGLSRGARDAIADFNALERDRIDLSGIDANPFVAGDQAFHLIEAASFTGAPGQVRVTIGATATLVEGDVDGDRAADFELELMGRLQLTADSFVL